MKESILFLSPKGSASEVIKAAAARGYNIFVLELDTDLVNSLPSSCQTLIDSRIQISSWTDTSSLLEVARKLNSESPIKGIYFSIEPPALAACILRKEFGLPAVEAESMKLITNKLALRKKLSSLGLSKLKAYSANEMRAITEWPFRGAAYFKPVYGLGSAYVCKCHNFQELQAAVSRWNAKSDADPLWVKEYLNRDEEYFVEEEALGELLSIEGLNYHGEFKSLGLLSRILYTKNHIVEMGSCFPYPHPLTNEISAFSEKLHKRLGFSEGPSHVEIIVTDNGEIELVDFNPRFVGADVLQSLNNAYEMRIEETLLDFALGKNCLPLELKIKNYSCLQYILPPNIDTFEKITFPADKAIKFTSCFKKAGDRIKRRTEQLDYLGCYLTVMPTFQEALSKSKSLKAKVIINDEFSGEY